MKPPALCCPYAAELFDRVDRGRKEGARREVFAVLFEAAGAFYEVVLVVRRSGNAAGRLTEVTALGEIHHGVVFWEAATGDLRLTSARSRRARERWAEVVAAGRAALRRALGDGWVRPRARRRVSFAPLAA